jgi:ribosomal protein S18 acetylase RimI-like enzyme
VIDPNAIELHRNHTGMDGRALENLFALVNLGGRKGDKLRRAFLNSQAVCYGYDSKRLVGVVRAISDGEYHATIYDVAVHPDYQVQGVGRLIMQDLLEQLPVWRVMLVASADV